MKGSRISEIGNNGLVSYSYDNKTNDNIDERPSFSMNNEQDLNISNISLKRLGFISYDNSKSTNTNKKRKINYDMDIDLLVNNNINNFSDDKSIKKKKKKKKKNKSM